CAREGLSLFPFRGYYFDYW
nr:immunoglobulin heavy chain junction region [Mus musculus]